MERDQEKALIQFVLVIATLFFMAILTSCATPTQECPAFNPETGKVEIREIPKKAICRRFPRWGK